MSAALLKLIASVPVGERLPLGSFARELNSTQAAVSGELEQLLVAGKLDARTMRPIAGAAECSAETAALTVERVHRDLTGAELFNLLSAEALRRQMHLTAMSTAIFQHAARIHQLRGAKRQIRRLTAERVHAWLEGRVFNPATGGARTAAGAGGGGIEAGSATTTDTAVSGKQLADELREAAAAKGVTIRSLIAPLCQVPKGYLACLERSKRPHPATVARVRALIAGKPLPPPPPSGFQSRSGGPSPNKQKADATRAEISAENNRLQQQLQLTDEARETRKPGQTLADRIREIRDRLEAEAKAERDDRELAALATPNALIRRAQRDWPELSAKVSAAASAQGISRGDAWLRVITAGVQLLSEGEA
jgi:hypothetical protein